MNSDNIYTILLLYYIVHFNVFYHVHVQCYKDSLLLFIVIIRITQLWDAREQFDQCDVSHEHFLPVNLLVTVYCFSYFVYNKMFCVYIFEERVKFIVDLLFITYSLQFSGERNSP